MIRREHFLSKLREFGYRYARETDRVYIYQKPGTRSIVIFPRRELLDADNVRNMLLQCGCPAADVEKFLTTYRVTSR